MNKYDVLGVVGEGAYGVVLRCRNKDNDRIVALKKFKESEENDVVRKTTMRELKLLRMMRHENIVLLLEAFRRKGRLYLVFEYVEQNLLEVLEDNPNGLEPPLVQNYIFQLCHAIQWCHMNDVIHRDIKPENLLIDTRSRRLKLCDFGFARVLQQRDNKLTDYVATRWYRAPELLLGSTDYDFSVDVWAIGCIMGEITDGQPLFPGESEIDQLYIIQKMLGPLVQRHLDLFHRNPRFDGLTFPDMSSPETLQTRYMGVMGKHALFFMRAILQMEPSARISIQECCANRYFEGLQHMSPHAPTSRPHQRSDASAASREPNDVKFAMPRMPRENKAEPFFGGVDGTEALSPMSIVKAEDKGRGFGGHHHQPGHLRHRHHESKAYDAADHDLVRLPSTRRLSSSTDANESGDHTHAIHAILKQSMKTSGKKALGGGSRKSKKIGPKVNTGKTRRKKRGSTKLKAQRRKDYEAESVGEATRVSHGRSVATTAIATYGAHRDNMGFDFEGGQEEATPWEDPYDFDAATPLQVSSMRRGGRGIAEPPSGGAGKGRQSNLLNGFRPTPPNQNVSHGGQMGRPSRHRHNVESKGEELQTREETAEEVKAGHDMGGGRSLAPMHIPHGNAKFRKEGQDNFGGGRMLLGETFGGGFQEDQRKATGLDTDGKSARAREIDAFREFSSCLPAKLKRIGTRPLEEDAQNRASRYPTLQRLNHAPQPDLNLPIEDISLKQGNNSILPHIAHQTQGRDNRKSFSIHESARSGGNGLARTESRIRREPGTHGLSRNVLETPSKYSRP
eukprot:CAMPEP_0118867806 /NCGR_PEP_ID=MMETSP1163-20130328/11271_1 /TAXON_ID=124430 /ORGANISM="Phaeomonas parva, Strain CCMP2877" /LENGTH=790 /DNA_ID=CAMNT_0006802263 /DNA_START=249 /DNA_END=2621 /DNA_ORIENTATION=+